MNAKNACFAGHPSSWWLLFCLLLCCVTTPAMAWWNQDWQYRKKIMLDASPTGVPLTEHMARITVLLRLHSGNFNYFFNTKPDGADVRFIASDDKTPLKFHIEHYDSIAGLATLWVQVPALNAGSRDLFFWMYYGNEAAATAADPAGTYDVSTVAVYHFAERTGLPKDSSAFSSHAAESSATLGQPGVIDFAAGFNPSSSIRVPSTPAVGLSAGKGFTFTAWLKLTKSQHKGLILAQGAENSGFRLELVKNNLSVRLASDRSTKRLQIQGVTPLAVDRWYHIGVTAGTQLKLFVDGQPVSSVDSAGMVIQPADLIVGAIDEGSGFTGLLDEVQLANEVRPDDWLRLAAKGQGPDGKLIAYGEDESEGNQANGGFTYTDLLMTLAKAVSVDGWVIIGVTIILGLIAFDVMISRYILLRRVEQSDDAFLSKVRELMGGMLQDTDISGKKRILGEMALTYQQSVIFRVFHTGVEELEKLFVLAAARGTAMKLTSEGLEVIRSGLDVTILSEENRLNARMVLVTVAISGAPFLGLLGTVVGVMMTFATVAATGDVNVNTIAPGVASAMSTTVVGLFIAIPCMFGYNYLATLISKRMAAMEVFADQLVSTIAISHPNDSTSKDMTNAPPDSTQTL